MESFMEVIKTGKIALLISEPGRGMVSFVQDKIKKEYPDVYYKFIGMPEYVEYTNASNLKSLIDEENTELLTVECDFCENDVFEYLETLKDKMAIIVFVHEIPAYIKDNQNYVLYFMNTAEEQKAAYYG